MQNLTEAVHVLVRYAVTQAFKQTTFKTGQREIREYSERS